MSFENVTWNGCVGNLEIVGEKIIFSDDKQSVNDFNCKIEIPIDKIDKQKLKNDLLDMKKPLIIHIENSKVDFEFNFNYIKGYKQFADLIFSKL